MAKIKSKVGPRHPNREYVDIKFSHQLTIHGFRMKESAVSRTPVEIWDTIFRIILQSPLFPTPYDNFFQSKAVLTPQCEAYIVHRSTMQLATVLRLVCRTWDVAVQRAQPFFLFCDFVSEIQAPKPTSVILYPTSDVLLRAQRLHVGYRYCDATRCLSGKKCPFSSSRTGPIIFPRRGWDPQNSSPALGQVQVLMSEEETDASLKNIIDCASSLKALSWSLLRPRVWFRDIAEHQTLGRLTHMKLRTTWASLSHFEHPIRLQQLSYLSLAIISILPDKNARSFKRIAKWALLPNLLFLDLFAEYSLQQNDEIYAFLSECGSNLSTLVLKIHSLRIDARLSECAPRLAELGPGIDQFLKIPILPPKQHSLKRLILDPLTQSTGDMRGFKVETDTALLLGTCNAWGIREICLFQSWDDTKRVAADPWYSPPPSKTYKRTNTIARPGRPFNVCAYIEFYRRAKEFGIMISDCEGVAVTSFVGRRCLAALERIDSMENASKSG